MKATELHVTLSKASELAGEGPRQCICSINEHMARAADIRIETVALAHGVEVTDYRGSEWRCPDGASLLADAARRVARTNGLPFFLHDETGGVFMPGELDEEWSE